MAPTDKSASVRKNTDSLWLLSGGATDNRWHRWAERLAKVGSTVPIRSAQRGARRGVFRRVTRAIWRVRGGTVHKKTAPKKLPGCVLARVPRQHYNSRRGGGPEF
jgi:hypothetical protein